MRFFMLAFACLLLSACGGSDAPSLDPPKKVVEPKCVPDPPCSPARFKELPFEKIVPCPISVSPSELAYQDLSQDADHLEQMKALLSDRALLLQEVSAVRTAAAACGGDD